MSFTAADSSVANSIYPTENCSWSPALNPIWVVLHTMETPEHNQISENIAGWFANPIAQTSAHYCVDPDSVVQCVDERACAWAAMQVGNANGIHIEMAGRAAQTAAEWADAPSQAILARTAALTADICRRHNIPAWYLTDQQLANGEKGITTHAQISRVFKQSDHTDPGGGFPMDQFIGLVRKALGMAAVQSAAQVLTEGEEMSQETLNAINANLTQIVKLLSPEVPGQAGVRNYTPAGAVFQKLDNISRQVQELKDAATPGREGVKIQGSLDHRLSNIESNQSQLIGILTTIAEKKGL